MTTWIGKISKAAVAPDPEKAEEQAAAIMKRVNDPKAFKKELFTAVALPMVQEFVDAANAQIEYHADVIKEKYWKKDATTTAQEAAEKYGIDLSELLNFIDEFDSALKWPDWMIDSAVKALAETIRKPYWADINTTFAGRAEALLKEGIERGLSIADIAKEMREASGDPNDRWIVTRTKNIARTETGNMAGQASDAAIQKVNDESGLDLRKVWISVFSANTRPSHAAMHDKESDDDGMFDLEGYKIPWPSHTDLPAKHRCNCMCDTVSNL